MIAWKVVRCYRKTKKFYPIMASMTDITYEVGKTTKAIPAPLSIGIGLFLFETRKDAEVYLRKIELMLRENLAILRVSVRMKDLLPYRSIIGVRIPAYIINDRYSIRKFYDQHCWTEVAPPKGTIMARSVRVLEEVGR